MSTAYVEVWTLPERAPVEYDGTRWQVWSPADGSGDRFLFRAGSAVRVDGSTQVLALAPGTPVVIGSPHPAAPVSKALTAPSREVRP